MMLPPPQFRPNFPVFAAIPPPPRYETQYHRDTPLDVPPPPPPRLSQPNKPFKSGPVNPPVPGTALFITDIPESIQFADLRFFLNIMIVLFYFLFLVPIFRSLVG